MEQTNAQNNALIPVGSGFTTLVTNFGGVESTGIELEGTFLVGDNFTFGGSIASYDPELGPGSVIGGSADPVTGEITGEDVSGGRPNNSPDSTYVLWGEYEWSLANGSSLAVRADVQNRSTVWGRLPNRDTLLADGTPVFLKPELDNIGFNLTWTSASGQTAVVLWGRNLSESVDYDTFGPADRLPLRGRTRRRRCAASDRLLWQEADGSRCPIPVLSSLNRAWTASWGIRRPSQSPNSQSRRAAVPIVVGPVGPALSKNANPEPGLMRRRLFFAFSSLLSLSVPAAAQDVDVLVARGGELYNSAIGCHTCHGATGEGLVGPSLHFGPSPVDIFEQLESNPGHGRHRQ